MRRTVAEHSRTMSGQDTDMSVTAKYVNKPKSTELKFDTKSYGHMGWLLPVMSCGVTVTHSRTHTLTHSHTPSPSRTHTTTLQLTTHNSQLITLDQTVTQTEKILSTVL